jgi:serine/threonine protein kinase
MKPSATPTTPAQLVELIRHSGVLSPAEVQAIEERWPRDAGDTTDVGRFARWLVARGYLTEYQTALLLHGHTAALFVGPYKLLDRIGRGSLAVVYAATRTPGELVALKVLPPSRARDRRLRARFQHEAVVACQLGHPNIVRALEAGEADGVHYLALEYLLGENMREAIERRGPLPIADVLHVARQTLAGLQYLFAQGLVHRNLEPANLMLVWPAGSDIRTAPLQSATVKVLDTSLSRSLFAESVPEGGGHSRLTFEGQLVGTPEFLAPEQARDAGAADIRSDLYSLGCMLFHALTGAPPFQDSSPLGVVIRHAVETARPIRELRGDVPVALAQTIGRLLAKDPADRFATPADVAAALPEKIEEKPAAVLVAPPAAPRVARPVHPKTILAPPKPATPADLAVEVTEPSITVELVPAAKPALPPVAPAAVPIDVELAPIPPPSPVPPPRTAEPRRLSVWLFVLLGGLGLLAVQVFAWLLAHLVFLLS